MLTYDNPDGIITAIAGNLVPLCVRAPYAADDHVVPGRPLRRADAPGLRAINQNIDACITWTSCRSHASAVLRAACDRCDTYLLILMEAAIGLYGVTAYAVAQRTNAIGIRMELGADRGRVVRSVLAQAFLRVLAGFALGLPLALGAARLIATQLYGVSSWDPVALAVAASALGICSLIAALIPAGVAASISPMSALRAE